MKLYKRVCSFLLTMAMIIMMCMPAMAAEEVARNRYNVVFVTDESGSMKWTDPDQLRYEAIRRFVALMAQSGNSLGSVTFGEGILATQDMSPISGFDQKEAYVENLLGIPMSGYTNIGLGLLEAVKLLDAGADPANPSVIILLSDGNTDMATKEELQESLDQKAEAIELARQAGYQIYTISLNTDGSADNSELEQIASATGGEFREVTNPEDLEEIQTMYYKMIFGAVEGEDAQGLEINNEGYVEKEFEVPGIGIEEFNVLLEGKIDQCSLTDANGYEYSEQEVASMSMIGENFAVIKVQEPVGGIWKVVVYGEPGAKVNFRLLYNSDFYITTSMTPETGYKLDDTVTFGLTVCDRRGPITDQSQYSGFTAQLLLNVNGKEQVLDMSLKDGGYTCDVKLNEQGTYYVSMTAANGECTAVSDITYELNVDNDAPVPAEEELKGHANIWPIIGGSASVDLKDAATDPDGDELTFSVESTAFMPGDYTLDGTTLTVNNFSITKGSFDIRATDPYGAYCTVPVAMTSTNIGLVMAILAAAGILIALIVIALVIRHLTSIPFMGTISVEKHDADDTSYTMPATLTPGRGRVRIEAFGIGTCGLPAGSYFQAGGKDKKIYFVSKTPVFSDAVAGPSKKVPIDGSGLEVLICTDVTLEKGMRVTFQSMLNNQFDF